MKSRSTVVVADDEPLTRMDFCQIFTSAGYDVVAQAKDGFEAVEFCRQLQPDIVVMDVKMPLFGGLGAAETIVQEALCPCVVLITAYNDEEIINRANRIGIMAYLVKPISEKEMIPAVSVALARSREIQKMKADMAAMVKSAEGARLVEQAKGILAFQQGISETEAFALLRKLSMDKRCPISKIAERVVAEKSERALLNQAKDVLMDKDRISENDAYAYLKRRAHKDGLSVYEAAAAVLRERA